MLIALIPLSRPQSRLPAEAFDGSDGVGNNLVPVAFFFSEDQKMLLWLNGGLRPAAATECHKENKQRPPPICRLSL